MRSSLGFGGFEGERLQPLEPTVSLYFDAVLHARDVLLAANIQVIEYDLHPKGVGALLIRRDDLERGLAALTSRGIQCTATRRAS